MNLAQWIRQMHRWFSMIFLAAVVFNTIEVARGKYTNTLGLIAVVPLAFLLSSGVYLFALPYTTKWKSPGVAG